MKEEIIVTTPSVLKSLIEESVRKTLLEKEQSSSQTDTNQPKFLSTEEAALFLNISISTIHRYTSKRIIPFFKQGKKLYFKIKELEQWLEKGRKKTSAQLKSEINEIGTITL